MKQIQKITPIILLIALSLSIGISSISASSFKTNQDDKSKIESLIDEYFATRYQSGKTNIDQDFSPFIDANSKSIIAEIEKIKLENYINRSKNLFFSSYDYDLEYIEFNIGEDNSYATVILNENSDVIYNISMEIDKDNPILTKLRNLKHKIELTKSDTDWKISADNYEDLVWKFIHGSGSEYKEVINIINNNLEEENIAQILTTPSCNLPYDETTHEYNRYGAVDYAKKWALSRNPEYYDFQQYDCTNFISQAIHEGSLAAMSNESLSGWYYYDVYNRGVAWAAVDAFHVFTTHEYERDYFYQFGPEGCDLLSKYDLRLGDIVQFDFELDSENEFEHSVIITAMEYVYGENFYYFSAHSDNYVDKPLDSVLTYLDRRFIRIERIDGEIQFVYLPNVINSSENTLISIAGDDLNLDNQAYPAPGTSLINPTETPRIGYP